MSATENAGALPGHQPTGAAYITDPSMAGPGPQALAFDGLESFPPAVWLEKTSLADHPLLRGLLLELPPKGTTPSPERLDRWFEAARSILGLIYAR